MRQAGVLHDLVGVGKLDNLLLTVVARGTNTYANSVDGGTNQKNGSGGRGCGQNKACLGPMYHTDWRSLGGR